MLKCNVVNNKTLKIKNFGESSAQSVCSFFFFRKNKKAQVSDALTWVVATLVIIFLIVSSIYVSSLMGKSKTVEKQKIVISEEDSIDWIQEKTEFAFGINANNKDKIEIWILGSDINEK